MIKAFIFDIGNVLLRFDFGIATQKVATECSIAPHQIFDRVAPLKDLYESGHMDRAEFLRQAIVELGFTGTEEELMAAWQDIFVPNEPMYRLVECLAPNYPLYLLSNTSDLHLEWFLEKYDIFRHFHDGVYSHIARCMKPNPEIYQAAFRQFGVEPASTIFIDDLPANVKGAKAAGLQAIQYDPQHHEGLLDTLRTQHGISC